MIISRAPLRITLAGGGTDLPSYSNIYGGKVLSAAIQKYVYVSVITPFDKSIILKYSENEKTNNLNNIRHIYFKKILKKYKIFNKIEITALADIPSGTGLGSSGSFSVALISSINQFKKIKIDKKKIAELASLLEIKDLNLNVGRQDQYIAAFGGLRKLTFKKKSNLVSNINISKKFEKYLEANSVLFFTGFTRSASNILQSQNKLILQKDNIFLKKMKFVNKNCQQVEKALSLANFEYFADLINEQWQNKMNRSKNISNSNINDIISFGKQNGALSGKLLGAGGGGFIFFLTKEKDKLVKNIKKKFNLNPTNFNFDHEGVKTFEW